MEGKQLKPVRWAGAGSKGSVVGEEGEEDAEHFFLAGDDPVINVGRAAVCGGG